MHRCIRMVLLTLTLTALVVVAPTPSVATQRISPTAAQELTSTVSGSHTFDLARPADYVAAYWRGDPRARVRLAFSADGSHFGAPVPAGRDDLGRQLHGGMTYGALRSAQDAVAVRVLTDRPVRVTVLAMADGVTQTRVTVTSESAAASTSQPAVISRSGWGADPAYMTWAPKFYATKKLIVHHTDTANDYADRAGAEAQIRSIYYYHSVTQGWGDIGYNFLIDKFGNIYEGRYSRDYAGASPSGDDASGNGVTGAHTSGWNSGTVGIAMLGTFTGQDVTPAARQALEDLLAWEASRNGIDPQATQAFVNPVSGATITTPNIAGHRDYAATACPGDTLYATLPTIRSNVASRLAGSPPPPTADTSPPSTPTSLSGVGGKNRVTLSWASSTDETGVAGYQVWRSRSASTGFSQIATTATTSYADGSLARRTTYYYKVRAYDGAGNVSGFSQVASARTS